MKILHVITSLLPGGAEKLVAELSVRFRDLGIDCEVAVFSAQDTALMQQLLKSGIKVHRFDTAGSSPYSPSNYFKLKKLIKSSGYDIVHTHNTAAQLFAALARGDGKCRYVTTEHNTDNRRRGIAPLRLIDRWMYRRYDSIICISDKTAHNLLQHIGNEYAPKVTVIKNGIDIPRYTSAIRPIAPDRPIVITMVAGFREQKDQDTLVRAMAQVPGRYHLQLVGDGVRRPQVEALVNELGIHKKVDFLGVRSDIAAILRDTDITVLSTHYEGLSLASIEAMASGRPLVASDVDGVREVVQGHGLLFPEGDAEALSKILLRLGSDPTLYQATAEACQKEAAKYDIRDMAAKYAQIYKSTADV